MTIEERLQKTREIHQQLMDLWNVPEQYRVMISVFPAKETYQSIELTENVHTSEKPDGTHQIVATKRLFLQESYEKDDLMYEAATFYRR